MYKDRMGGIGRDLTGRWEFEHDWQLEQAEISEIEQCQRHAQVAACLVVVESDWREVGQQTRPAVVEARSKA